MPWSEEMTYLTLPIKLICIKPNKSNKQDGGGVGSFHSVSLQ
jgi:hypothetical protein